jgi:hypothetical protein
MPGTAGGQAQRFGSRGLGPQGAPEWRPQGRLAGRSQAIPDGRVLRCLLPWLYPVTGQR